MGSEAEAAKPANNGTPPPTVKTVPQERFNAVVAEKKLALERVAALEAETQGLTERAATADTLATQLEELRAGIKAKEVAWGEERALLSAGITDPDDADLVRYQYGRIPDKDRPKSIAEFVANLRTEAAKPEGERVLPKVLAYIFAGTDQEEPRAGAAAGTGKPPPKTPGNTGKAAPTTEAVTVEALRELRARAQASGSASDWKTWQEAADAAMAARAKK